MKTINIENSGYKKYTSYSLEYLKNEFQFSELNRTLTIDVKDNEQIHIEIPLIDGQDIKKIIVKARENLIGVVEGEKNNFRFLNFYSKINSIEKDYIVIEADLISDHYKPERRKKVRFVTKCKAISGKEIYLEETIPYRVKNAKLYTIPKTKLTIVSLLNSVALEIKNIVDVNLLLAVKGSLEKSGVFVNNDTSYILDAECRFDNAYFNIGLALNNITRGYASVTQLESGNNYNESKVCRLNCISNFRFDYSGLRANFRDIGIHAARNSKFNITSNDGGYYYEKRKDNGGNRLETVVFAECEGIDVKAQIENANDQALELISCVDVHVSGKISNSSQSLSTEGAFIIKGHSSRIHFEGTVEGKNSRGIKIECWDGAHSIVIGKHSKVYSTTNAAISIRDSRKKYDANIKLEGIYSGKSCIEIKSGAQNTIVDACLDIPIRAVGIIIQENNTLVKKLEVLNSKSNATLIYVGSHIKKITIDSLILDKPGHKLKLPKSFAENFNPYIDASKEIIFIIDDKYYFFLKDNNLYSDVFPDFFLLEKNNVFIKVINPKIKIFRDYFTTRYIFNEKLGLLPFTKI